MKEIYHLHIPKTGGQFINSTIILPMLESFTLGNVILRASGHECWRSIDDSLYIISSFRDPAERTASHFVFGLKHQAPGYEDFALNKKSFFEWINKNHEYISNFQSKNLIHTKSRRNAPFFFYKDVEFLKIKNIDKKEILNNAKRINILLKTDTLSLDMSTLVRKKIEKDFGILSTRQIISPIYNKTDESSDFFSSLNSVEKQYLYDINKIDCEIYFNDALFDINKYLC